MADKLLTLSEALALFGPGMLLIPDNGENEYWEWPISEPYPRYVNSLGYRSNEGAMYGKEFVDPCWRVEKMEANDDE